MRAGARGRCGAEVDARRVRGWPGRDGWLPWPLRGAGRVAHARGGWVGGGGRGHRGVRASRASGVGVGSSSPLHLVEFPGTSEVFWPAPDFRASLLRQY